MPGARGACRICRRVMHVRHDGLLRMHVNNGGRPCTGSHHPPEMTAWPDAEVDVEPTAADEESVRKEAAAVASRFAQDPVLDRLGREVLEAIRDGWTQNGYGPNVREIGATVGLASTSSTGHRLRKLKRNGLIAVDDRTPRSIRLTPAGVAAIEGSFPLIPVRVDAEAGVIHIIRETA